ncbi:hypothetical protein STIAU_4923, partial [Stigmatella aurantiaca DW4/3-1]
MLNLKPLAVGVVLAA